MRKASTGLAGEGDSRRPLPQTPSLATTKDNPRRVCQSQIVSTVGVTPLHCAQNCAHSVGPELLG